MAKRWALLAALALWFVIKIGNKLVPRIDKLLDWLLDNAEIRLQDLWAKLTSGFEGKYYERLRFDYREYETQGINQERLLLENLFVPLKIAQKDPDLVSQNMIQQAGVNPLEQQEIGKLLGFYRSFYAKKNEFIELNNQILITIEN